MQKNKIDKLITKNKARVEFIIILFVLIVVLQILIYFTSIFKDIKEVIILLIILLEFVFLLFNILIIITNSRLKKLIKNRKIEFDEIIQKKEDNININNIVYKKDKHLSEEEIDRIDIFSKKNRKIISNDLIEGTYKNISFKSYNIELEDKNHTFIGKWIILDTYIKDNISIYISNKKRFKKELIYPKNLFEEYKNKDNKVLVKNKNNLIIDMIDLKNNIGKDIYISIINDKLQILVFTSNNDMHIEREIKEIYNYLDKIYLYIDKLEIIKKQ